jgi:hypothetical protein
MRGLRTQESDRFNRFFRLIQEEASRQNAVFFAFAGEGNDLDLPELEGEDMSGWLVPQSCAEKFEAAWMADNSMVALEQWGGFFTWAVWEKHGGTVTISFENYG